MQNIWSGYNGIYVLNLIKKNCFVIFIKYKLYIYL